MIGFHAFDGKVYW